MRSISPIRIFLFAFLFICLPDILFAQTPGAETCAAVSTTITPSASCAPITYNIHNAVSEGIAATCGTPAPTTTTTYDRWFSFATSPTATAVTITLSAGGGGSNLSATTTYVEVFNGTCGTLTTLACSDASTPLALYGLSVSTTYYFRVYVTTNPNVGNANKFDYTMCVFYPSPLTGDECASAISLTSGTGCINTSSTLVGITASAGIPTGCAASGTHYDRWFSFVASRTSHTVTFKRTTPSNISNPELQLFSGTCGTLTSLQCGTTSIAATGLTVGATYYVRVSQVGGSALTTRGAFDICVTHTATPPATIDYSKSYVNISKGTGGGSVVPGDTLEIRATFVVRSGTSGSADSLAFYDTLYATEGLALVPGSLALRTNEGKLYKAFTDNYDTDAGWKLESANNSADTVIQINFGANASNVRRGSLTNTSRPSVFGSTAIVMATYRVVVTTAYNNLINIGGGALTLSNAGNYSDLKFNPTNVMVYSSPGLCPNAVSPTNTLGAESNGTFGSGTTQNRAASPFTTYTYTPFNPAGPNDYFYGVANNTSTTGTTVNTWAKPNSNRVHNLWDISGDHTSATNPLIGNSPTAIGSNGGYMLVINSAYKADTAFTYTISNLCPGTYYEISAWFKNICYKCGCDSTGAGTSSGTYIPTAPGDSSGVRPNIAFDVDGADYYTTGDLLYLGLSGGQTGSDAANRWVKKGFTYLTGPAQTSFTLTLRNNAPGGGGNDWALDDIAVATCSPDMTFTPSFTPNVCTGNTLDLTSTVSSYFNNYTYYKWQSSTNNGTTWTDESGVNSTGIASPVLNSGQYHYTTPAHTTQPMNTGDNVQYRLVTATTASNLATSTCVLADTVNVVPTILSDCAPVLGTHIISFNVNRADAQGILRWTTSKETEPFNFVIEGSTDGQNFSAIGRINSSGMNGDDLNGYTWSEAYRPGKYYYRIKMYGTNTGTRYSRVVAVDGLAKKTSLVSIINPFNSQLTAYVDAPEAGIVRIQLIDNMGLVVKSQSSSLQLGANQLILSNTSRLPAGMYTLKIISHQSIITKKVVKQ